MGTYRSLAGVVASLVVAVLMGATTAVASPTAITGGVEQSPAGNSPRQADVSPASTVDGNVFVPVEPFRAMDTRRYWAPVEAGESAIRTFSVAWRELDAQYTGFGPSSVPSGATAVAYNLTVPNPASAGHLRVMPGDSVDLTAASAINFRAGETVANGLTTKIDRYQSIKVYASTTAHVVIDVLGYYMPATATDPAPPPGGKFTPITPMRVYDSARDPGGLLASKTDRVVSVTTTQDGKTPVIPAGAKAVAYNLTVVRPNGPGHLRVMPGDVKQTAASAINWTRAGEVIANGLTVKLDADRRIRVYNNAGAPVRFLVDVVGYYSNSGALFYPTDPARVLDTRNPRNGGGAIPNGQLNQRLAGVAADINTGTEHLPAGASAIAYNLTATDTTSAGHLRVYPAGKPLVDASAINWPGPGYTRANGSVVEISPSRQVHVYNGSSTPTSAVIDLLGYYVSEPATPGNLKASWANQAADLSWSPVNGTDHKDYMIYQGQTANGPWSPATVASAAGTTQRISGLANGTTYWFTVASRDFFGNESVKAPAVAVTPRPAASAPSAPTGLRAASGNTSTWIVFGTPTDDGGMPITNYQYSLDDGATWRTWSPTVTKSPATISGLQNGKTYKLKIRAVNQVGPGAASNAWPVTPSAPPKLPAGAIDTTDRNAVINAYSTRLAPALATPRAPWNGSLETCDPGTTDAAYDAATLQAVNYFRAMSGRAAVANDPVWSAKATQAALVMSANRQLSHAPPSDWKCWSGAALEAAGRSTCTKFPERAQSRAIWTTLVKETGRLDTAGGWWPANWQRSG